MAAFLPFGWPTIFKPSRMSPSKIMSSGDYGKHEYHMQEVILQDVQDTSHLVTYLGTFLLHGDGCNHRVLVFPLRGPAVNWDVPTRPLPAHMSAARQLLEALANLHKSGIVHRGELIKPIQVPEDLRTNMFYLGDFGQAAKIGSSAIPAGEPPIQYCSPDRLHKKGSTPACDMWSYMCIFAQLYIGWVPFNIYQRGIIASIIRIAGPLPEQWKGHYVDPHDSRDEWYYQNQPFNPEAVLNQYLRKDIDPVERRLVISVMSRGFCAGPEKRLTAAQLLQDPSFKAIMDIYCP
ncbi:predicted protein [Uncinocarpus reesii 1704]|uniref:Protein kinase domain-containing protein n=1 Tax=Uncinocarpus reesii (strain UAMH 1704) TaxID=336963 RepID=C4JLI3_UNCRE|nr:uncharacterized protein UREG_03691 [Uncinocarpus reesii 1704]EEP78845.1 predicted protein [Uncinocarpus reesii 1704]